MKSALYKSNFRFNALDASKLVQLDSSSRYSNSILQLQRDGITSSAFAMMEVHTPRIDPPPRKSPTAYKHSESIALRYQLGSAGNEVITHVLPRRSILLDTGAQASSTGFDGIPGTQRRPDGTLGRPLQLVGGVGRPARVQAIQCVRVRDPESGFVFDIPDDCKAPDWSTAVISAGALASRGVRIGLDGDPRLVFPSGHVVKLHKRRHLYLLDLENVSLTGATPTASRATMVAAKTLEEPLIEVFEPFAGIGTFSRALRKHGAKIIALLEHSEPPRRYLRAEFPGTLLLGEYRMREWTTQVNWTKGAIRLMVTGAICTPFAPNGKMLGLEDHRNAEVFGVVALAHACRPHVIVLDGGLPKGAATFDSAKFRSVLGMLMYIATRTRPDLLFSVGVLATVSAPSASCPEAPCPGHRAALQRSLRYLVGTTDLGLLFQRLNNSEIRLEAWCDASHGREIHHTASGYCKSRSGGFITLNMAVVSAFSAVQGATALSTFEAELYALVQVIRQILALRHLITFLIGVTLPPTVVHCDNNSVLLQLKRRDLSARSRHIRVHLGFIFDALEANEIDAQFVRSGENPANAMTAAEDRDRFARSVDVMTGRPPEGPARDVRPSERAA